MMYNTPESKVLDLDAKRPHVASVAVCWVCCATYLSVVIKTVNKQMLQCPDCGHMTLGVLDASRGDK